MKKAFSKYVRGQVYFIDDGHLDKKIGSEEMKSRPWVIISCDDNNYNSPCLSVAPVSSKKYDGYPFHVHFVNPERGSQIIEVEQTTCKSIKRFELSGSHYMYTLSDEIMEKVDEAICVHFGVQTRTSRFLKQLEDGIDRIINTKLKELKELNSGSPDMIDKLTARMNDFFSEVTATNSNSENSGEDHQVPKVKNTTSQIDKFNKRYGRTEQSSSNSNSTSSSTSTPKKKSGRTTWTNELMKQYVEDCKTMSLSDVALKYGLKDSNVAAQYKYKFISKLREVDGGDGK